RRQAAILSSAATISRPAWDGIDVHPRYVPKEKGDTAGWATYATQRDCQSAVSPANIHGVGSANRVPTGSRRYWSYSVSFRTKPSNPPVVCRGPQPKSTETLNEPVTTRFPSGVVFTAVP